jgi:hypothetical protein
MEGMRFKTLAIFVLLNAAALGIGFVWLGHEQEKSRAQADAVDRARLAQIHAMKAAKIRTAPPKTVTVYKTNQFQWSQIETADYRQYIANLRGIGCPEATIRDLIMTDVMRLYAQRRGKYYHNGREFKYWETDEKRKVKKSQFAEREEQLASIDKELPAVLRELLGVNYERELNKYFVDTGEEERRLSFLSEDKRDQVTAIRDRWESQRDALLAKAKDGALTVGDLALLKQYEQERDREMLSVLTPQEKEQYELSTSETANRLRGELVGFNPTEKEFREIYALRQALDEKYAYQNLSDESIQKARAEDEARMHEELKTVLGQDRLAEMDRSKDADYRDLATLSEQYDLPADTTRNVAEMRQIAQEEQKRLLEDTSIPANRRRLALKEMQAETEKAFRQAMGDEAFDAYVQGAGNWIRSTNFTLPLANP